MKLMRMSVLVLVATVAACAASNPGPDPNPPPKAVDTPSDCRRACDRLRYLGCREGQGAADGSTCEQVCDNVAEAGISLNTACVQAIASCDDVRDCVE